MDNFHEIVNILKIEPQLRKKSDQLCVAQYLETLKYFKDKQDKAIQAAMLGRLQSLRENKTLFKINTEGNTFYIILKGSVEIHAKSPNFSTDMTLQSVKILSEGDSFGELSLIFDQKRLASVISKEDCYFLTLTKEEYCEEFFKFEMQKMRNYVNFLSSIPLIKEFKFTQVQDIYLVCDEFIAQKGQILSEENQTSDYIYFIFEGEFTTFKTFEHSVQTKEANNSSQPSSIEVNQLNEFQVGKMGKYEILLSEAALNQERLSTFKLECSSYQAICLRISIDDFHKRVLQDQACLENLKKYVALRNDRLDQQRKTLMKSISQIQTYVLSEKHPKQLQLGQLGSTQSQQKFTFKKSDIKKRGSETLREGAQYISQKSPISLSPRYDIVKDNQNVITIQMNPSQDTVKQRERQMDSKKAYMQNIINTKKHVKPKNFLYEWRQKQGKNSQSRTKFDNPQTILPSINVISSLNNIQIQSDEEDRIKEEEDQIQGTQFNIPEQSNSSIFPSSPQLQIFEASKNKNLKLQSLNLDNTETIEINSTKYDTKQSQNLKTQNQQQTNSQTNIKGKSNSVYALFSNSSNQQKRKSLNFISSKNNMEDNLSYPPPASFVNLQTISTHIPPIQKQIEQTYFNQNNNYNLNVNHHDHDFKNNDFNKRLSHLEYFNNNLNDNYLNQNTITLSNPNFNKTSHHFRSSSYVSLPVTNNLDIPKNKRISFIGKKLHSPQQSMKNSPVKEPKFTEIDKKSIQDLLFNDQTKSNTTTNKNSLITNLFQQGGIPNNKTFYDSNLSSNFNYNLKLTTRDSPVKTNIFLQGNKMKNAGNLHFIKPITTAAQ